MDCIFCKIAAGEVPSVKVWEDDAFLAILDINPNREGVVLVLAKNHYDSDFSELPDDVASKFVLACQKVAKSQKRGLGVERVIMVAEGLGVDHAHFKLYPYYKGGEGHLTTDLGPQATSEELEVVAQKIRRN